MVESNPDKSILFTTYKMGDVELPNRIVAAAVTRCRADPKTGVATDLHVKYYTARASAGFILTECTPIRFDGDSFPGAVGIWNDT